MNIPESIKFYLLSFLLLIIVVPINFSFSITGMGETVSKSRQALKEKEKREREEEAKKKKKKTVSPIIGVYETVNKSRQALKEKEEREGKKRRKKTVSPIIGVYETVSKQQATRDREEQESQESQESVVVRNLQAEAPSVEVEPLNPLQNENASVDQPSSIIENPVEVQPSVCRASNPDSNTKRICFFALNGSQESKRLKDRMEGFDCTINNSNETTCTQEGAGSTDTPVKLEIKEFFADTGDRENVSQAFERMTDTHCDGLVISGYHVGYYSGTQTDQNQRKADKVDLNLSFLEKLSCLKKGTTKIASHGLIISNFFICMDPEQLAPIMEM